MNSRGDKPRILVGLAVALVGLTFPLWYSLAAGRGAGPPTLELPAGDTRCVEDGPTMRARHAGLLNEWRDAVVREGRTTYVSKAYGQRCQMSLTRTCLGCHTNRAAFCDQCHTYAGVRPSLNCWSCHNDASKKQSPSASATPKPYESGLSQIFQCEITGFSRLSGIIENHHKKFTP